LDATQRARVEAVGDGKSPLVRVTSFHPEYGYEDFIEGFRPSEAPNGNLAFSMRPGIFRQLCAAASASPDENFFLVIDEINRGDVPRIFGELLTLLERDKRGESLLLPASGEAFRVPTNVYLLGTMNTADRSIALMDVALRRRFGFVELPPDYTLLDDSLVGGVPIGPWLRFINEKIRSLGGGDSRNRQIGHAFLLSGGQVIETVDQFVAVLRDDIVPLLEEYCYEDYGQLKNILGVLIDEPGQRIRTELFSPGRFSDLTSAVCPPEMVTSEAAVRASANDALEDAVAADDDDAATGDPGPLES
jgi:5-methylcytosine-specific restriction protein B